MTRARAAAVLAFAAVAAIGFACTGQDVLSDLTPFPCANDGHCPDGYTCRADAGCVGSQGLGNKNVDDPCEGTDECPDYAGCTYGVCPGKTDSQDQCPSDRIYIGGYCLHPCGTAAPCPNGLVCAPVPAGSSNLAWVCISAVLAAEQDAPCLTNGGVACPSHGNTQLYHCIGGTCVLQCDSTSMPCPSDHPVCADPSDEAGYNRGCFKQ
jgi:hypothetical protein